MIAKPKLTRLIGVFIVEAIGAGLRSRAVIRRGSLHVTTNISDSGHEFTAIDGDGLPVHGFTVTVGPQK